MLRRSVPFFPFQRTILSRGRLEKLFLVIGNLDTSTQGTSSHLACWFSVREIYTCYLFWKSGNLFISIQKLCFEKDFRSSFVWVLAFTSSSSSSFFATSGRLMSNSLADLFSGTKSTNYTWKFENLVHQQKIEFICCSNWKFSLSFDQINYVEMLIKPIGRRDSGRKKKDIDQKGRKRKFTINLCASPFFSTLSYWPVCAFSPCSWKKPKGK